MPMSMLDIVSEALETIGVDAPNSLTSSTALQVKGLVNATGRDITMRPEGEGWQSLRVEASFTTVATEEQVNIKTQFPYLRRIVDNSLWNETQQRRVIGPVSAQTWRRYKADPVSPATLVFYMRNDRILFPGTPSAGDTVSFEYVDKRWCESSDGLTKKELMTANADVPRVDDYAIVLGVRWRYLQAKGLEYGEWFRQYEDWIAERIGSDTPHETLSVNPGARLDGSDQQIPDGSWNL